MDSGKKTILIVGINNLVGFYLSVHLSKNFQVIGTCSRNMNQYNKLEKYRFKILRKNSVKFIKYMSPKDSLIKIIKKLKPNIFIFNSFISKDWNNEKFKYGQIKKILFHELNESMNLLKRFKCQAIMVTGSSEDFKGRNNEIIEKFSDPPNNPYGKLKNLLGKKISLLSKKNNLNFAYLRLFSPYGLLDKKHKITEQLIKNKVVKIKNPNVLRNFTYVKDIAKSYEFIINYLENSNNESLIINISNNRKIKMKFFVSSFKDVFNTNINTKFSKIFSKDKYYYGNPSLKNKNKIISFNFYNIKNSFKDMYEDLKNEYEEFYSAKK